MINVYRSTSYLSLHGTIQGVPIRKCWGLFYASGILIIITILLTDWTDFFSIIGHVLFLTGIPFLLFFLAVKAYEQDPVILAAFYRKIFQGKGNCRNYEIMPQLFEQKRLNYDFLEEK
ncbi:hypothetical protein [Flexithrix dorotheae]|uniref:hypothetical protein n=1 Tax=Flexithrix dorotheae TaxID=70993 RepID=UPI0003685213|nr:hypothetical protein [Flexithrix dorotheae]